MSSTRQLSTLFYLPIAAAMYMAGIDGEKEHANALKILMEMGEFFQVQVGRSCSPECIFSLSRPGDLLISPLCLLPRTTTLISLETPV